ncbi:heavy metal-binding domain-containing protein [Enterococcus faecium]|nr:heavy metal-binding domain-containing protein [Enterococcus faecium]
MLITTSEKLYGVEYETLDVVFGVTTHSKNIGAGLKNLVGGEIKAYTEMQQEARKIAMDRLKEEAKNIGADAIIAMRFDSGSISNDMQSVVAYGTAVKFKNQ